MTPKTAHPQKEDLARIYRVFQRLGPKGLDPVALLFRKHVEAEGMQRVKEATEAAAAKKEKEASKDKEAGAPPPRTCNNVYCEKYLSYTKTPCGNGSRRQRSRVVEVVSARHYKRALGKEMYRQNHSNFLGGVPESTKGMQRCVRFNFFTLLLAALYEPATGRAPQKRASGMHSVG